MTVTMHHTNLLDWARTYRGPKYHALLCDPPYHLTEIVKRFGKADSAPAQYGTDGAFQRASRGFMGKQWDGGDIAFRPETWAALAEHLHPGAFGMAFASSRGWHRMAVAIEGLVGAPLQRMQSVSDLLGLAIETRDWLLVEQAKQLIDDYLAQVDAIRSAGLIIHPVIMCWAFGSGFPKATRIDTQIDRLAGAERATVGQRKHAPKFDAAGHGYREKDNGYNSRERVSFDVTAPATELAADWAGHRYGLQAMKPALEPIIVFQKPYAGRPIENIAETGAGALWIDGGRIGTDEMTPRNNRPGQNGVFNASGGLGYGGTGRWPANLLLQHTPDCTPGACVAECPAERLGAQSGETASGAKSMVQEGWGANGIYGNGRPHLKESAASTGTAARYFQQVDWSLDVAERLALADPAIYTAKASRAEREAGLDPRTVALMRLLDDSEDAADFAEQTVDDGRKKSIDNPYLRGETTRRNIHPTVKPLTLARYLATLLLPPARYKRRLLVPFAGSGSEVIGAMLAGWDVIDGIELEADHVAIANARIAYWQGRKHELQTTDRPIVVRSAAAPAGQVDMFAESEAA